MAGVLLLTAKSRDAQSKLSIAENTLKKANEALLGSYFQKIEYWTKGTSLLVHYRKESSPDIYFNNDGWIAIEGTAFDLNSEKIYTLKDLWDLYNSKGENFIKNLDGHFIIKLYDKAKDKILIFNDIIKSRTNYLAENKDFFLVTPFLITTALIKEPEVDLNALNELFWRYYILSERSLFKSVKRLSPASVYAFSADSYSYKEYWQFPREVASNPMDQYVEQMTESIQQSARIIAKVADHPVSDLTLGQDSRLIVASFIKNNLPISTTTFGNESFSEVEGVRKLTKRHNIDHQVINLDNLSMDTYNQFFRKALLLGSGDEPGYLLGRILYMRQQQALMGGSVISGSGGPFYKDCFWEEIYILNMYHAPKKINPAMFLKLRPMNKNYVEDMFNSDFLKIKNKSSEYFLEMLYNDLDGYEHLPLSMQIDKYSLHRWQNYAVIPIAVTNNFTHAFSPLQFRRNLEIGLPLPPQWKWNKSKFQRKVMHAINPSLAKEKTDFGGINMMPKNAFTFLPFYTRYSWVQTARMRNKILNRLGMQPRTHLQKAWDYLPLYTEYLKHPFIQEHIQWPGSQMESYLDKNNWQTWLTTLMEKPLLNSFEHSNEQQDNKGKYQPGYHSGY